VRLKKDSMKKRYIFLLVSLISVIGITILIKKDYTNLFIEETKEEISVMHNERDSIFSFVDETMSDLELERSEKQNMLDSLDKELIKKQNIVKEFIYSIEQNKKLNLTLENEKIHLESVLEETKNKLQDLIVINENTKEKLEVVHKEKEMLYNQYNSLQEIYQENTFIVVDTIYKIDTIYYTKDEIKKLILKNDRQ
jgi:hypothetical protein